MGREFELETSSKWAFVKNAILLATKRVLILCEVRSRVAVAKAVWFAWVHLVHIPQKAAKYVDASLTRLHAAPKDLSAALAKHGVPVAIDRSEDARVNIAASLEMYSTRSSMYRYEKAVGLAICAEQQALEAQDSLREATALQSGTLSIAAWYVKNAEERVQAAETRIRRMEEPALRAAEIRNRHMEELISRRVKDAEERMRKDVEERAHKDAEERVQAAQERVQAAQEQTQVAETRIKHMEELISRAAEMLESFAGQMTETETNDLDSEGGKSLVGGARNQPSDNLKNAAQLMTDQLLENHKLRLHHPWIEQNDLGKEDMDHPSAKLKNEAQLMADRLLENYKLRLCGN